MSEILLERPKEYLSLAEIAGVGNEGRFLRISPDGTRIEPVSLLDLRDVGIHGLTTGMVRLYEDGSVDGHSGQAFTRRGIIGLDSSGYVTSVIAGYDSTGSWWFNPNATGDKLVWASSSPGPDWTQVEPGEAVFGKGLITSELLVTPVDWQTQVAGTGKPEDNATLGASVGANLWDSSGRLLVDDDIITGNALQFAGGLLPNWNLNMVDSEDKPAGIMSVESIADRSQLDWGDSTKTFIEITNTPDGTVAYGFPAIPIDDKQTYTVTIRLKSEVATSNGLYLRFNEYNGALSAGKTHIGIADSGSHVQARTSFKDLVAYGPTPGPSWTEYTYTYTPTPGTQYASFCIYLWNTSIINLYIDYVHVIPSGSYERGATVGAPDSTPLGGMTVQDSVIGDGVFFTANGIEGWKAGKRTFLLDALTGDADFAGNISAATIDAGELLVKNGGDIILDSDTSNISELIFSYGGANFAEIFSYDTSVLMISPFSDGVADLWVSDPAVRWKLIQLQATDSLYFRTAYDVWFNVTRPVVFDCGINLQVLTPDYPVAGLTLYYDGSSLKARDSGGNTYVIQWTVI